VELFELPFCFWHVCDRVNGRFHLLFEGAVKGVLLALVVLGCTSTAKEVLKQSLAGTSGIWI